MKFNLDLDILHAADGEQRRSGRTIRMLTDAVQYADFLPEYSNVYVVGHSYSWAEWMMEDAILIAQSLEFEDIKRIDRNSFKIGEVRFNFISQWSADQKLCGTDPDTSVVLVDHFVLETMNCEFLRCL